ncbi:hypothetical protein [Massilia sp. 9096]|uniref:hypothetical protein n=1 Tax=Massilia sp. 9096 TaxID=1500894 RepID=UPI0012E07083|nr:hypothetical protein [Massilia sp. 9096]
MTVDKTTKIFMAIIFTSIIAFLGMVAFYLFYVIPNGELGQAKKWQTLKHHEYSHRADRKIDAPVLEAKPDGDSYSALGVPTEIKDTPFVWVLLDGGDDFYGPVKLVPQSIVPHVKCTFVKNLPKIVKVDLPVLTYLQEHCEQG